MRTTAHVMTTVALILCVTARAVAEQTPAELWRNVAGQVEVGAEIDVRLSNGRRLRATLVGARDDAILLQPKTRIPVPIQAVPYENIVRLARVRPGTSTGKAVAIGAVTGVGAFFATLALLLAAASD